MIHALRYTEELEKSGFTAEQAKKSVQIWMELMDQNFATKSDLLATKNDLQNEIGAVKNELLTTKNDLQKEIVAVKNELVTTKTDLQSEIVAVRNELQKEIQGVHYAIKELESKLTIKLGIMMATGLGIISAILNLQK